VADKIQWKGKWHLITAKGKLGDPCEPLVEGEDQQWVPDGAFGDFVRTGPSPISKPERRMPPGTRMYRVITQRDEFFKSSFNPEALEDLLNELSLDGWHVVSMVATDVGSFLGSFWAKGGGASRQELVVLLEKIAP